MGSEDQIPSRGEIWRVRFDPKVAYEIGNVRPALVVSEDSIAVYPLKIVVPVTTWKKRFINYPWMIRLYPNEKNQLKNESGADASQVKSVSLKRFNKKLGMVGVQELKEIVAAVALCIGYV